jgi:cysteine desulfurase
MQVKEKLLYTGERIREWFEKTYKRKVFLDYSAGAPMYKLALSNFKTLQKKFANPGGIYLRSVRNRKLLEEYRNKLLRNLGAKGTDSIVFTRGGTEANNIAIQGFLHDLIYNASIDFIPHIIISNIEHSSVRNIIYSYAQRGMISYSELPVDEHGIVDISNLRSMIKEETVLISVMLVNNETGAIQPVKEIAKIIRSYKKKKESQNTLFDAPYLHTDAIQAPKTLSINVAQLGVDLLVLSGAKIGASSSSGLIFVKEGTPITGLYMGGHQEYEIRPGTEDVPILVSFSKVLLRTLNNSELMHEKYSNLREEFIRQLKAVSDSVMKNYQFEITSEDNSEDYVPNIIHLMMPEVSPERVIIELDALGILVSSHSVCNSGEVNSHVIDAIFEARGKEANVSGLRFSLGPSTTKYDLSRAANALQKVLLKLQKESHMVQGNIIHEKD